MCVAKNEEALRIEPHFAECYGNMANAWKVSNLFLDFGDGTHYTTFVCSWQISCIFQNKQSFILCRRKETLTLQFATI